MSYNCLGRHGFAYPSWSIPWLFISRQEAGHRQLFNGPLTRYAKLPVAHAPGMSGSLSAPPGVSDPDMYHGTCATHVPWYMSGTPPIVFLWRRWWEKRSRHSRRMRDLHFYVSGKRPMGIVLMECSSLKRKWVNAKPETNGPIIMNITKWRHANHIQQPLYVNMRKCRPHSSVHFLNVDVELYVETKHPI